MTSLGEGKGGVGILVEKLYIHSILEAKQFLSARKADKNMNFSSVLASQKSWKSKSNLFIYMRDTCGMYVHVYTTHTHAGTEDQEGQNTGG